VLTVGLGQLDNMEPSYYGQTVPTENSVWSFKTSTKPHVILLHGARLPDGVSGRHSWTKENAANGTAIPPQSATLARQGFRASRTNAFLSVPMLFFMAAAGHYPMFGK